MQRILNFVMYAKKFVAALANALIVTGGAIADSNVTGAEWTLIISAWAASWAVFQLANSPKKP